jgi:hypothetical protein
MKELSLKRPVSAIFAMSCVLAVPFGAASSFAQSASTGTITGTVLDPTGAVVVGATVTATDPASKQARSTTTNKSGQYVLVDIPPATYDITATKAGFAKDEIPDLTVSVGTQTSANFRMAIGAENTTIEVQSSGADLQTINATTGTTVDSKLVDSLPAIGRDVATFVTFQPGVAPGGQVAGTTTDQATFQLDGGSNSSDMDGTAGVYTSNNLNSTTGGFLGTGAAGVVPMPQDSIEEFKVNTSGQTADFNNSTGSQSQIVTKRGHDKIRGTLYEYYLDNNFNANSWANNFPNASFTNGNTSYTPKPSYHYSRFGAAAGGPVLPYMFGGKTYLFGNYEGFRYPFSSTLERTVPSYQFLQLGQLSFGGTAAMPTTIKTQQQLTALDPRGIGMSATLKNFYNTQLPVAPQSNAGNVGNNGATYGGTFDQSCGSLSTSYCDGQNLIGFKANVLQPQSSNFLVLRADHDFGPKWHLMLSWRYYKFENLTANQLDIGGGFTGDKVGYPVAVTPRPQQPTFYVVGLTTNISPSLTNDVHFSYTRNFWQWKGDSAPPQLAGAGGAIEPLGENQYTVLSPYNVNAQNIRTRIWDGQDSFLRDDLSKLKGNHFIQFGGSYQHNFNYHQRTDNGASINYTPTYQIGDTSGGGNVAYSGNGLGSVVASGVSASNIQRQLDTYYGIVTDTQVANTYTNSNGKLSLNPPQTPIAAHTTIPYYNLYATDTWHMLPSLTLNYGLSYAIEMPPTERDGNQTIFTDVSGNPLSVDTYLNARKAAGPQGQIYNPEIGFAQINNVAGGRKYPYDPFYAALSPRISFGYNPKFKNEALNKLFGDGATVIRGGYGRIYGRINGDAEVLNPLLAPGLILATQCKYVQLVAGSSSGACSQTNYTDSTAYRIGTDGLSPLTASAPAPTTLAEPYHPGFDGPGVQLASPVDIHLRPSDADTFNLSVQRQLNRKMLLEIGYIGRLIHHEYLQMNPNQVPYNLSQGGQTFEAAYMAIETAFGCTVSASLCSHNASTAGTKTTSVNPVVAPQPFFETALNPSYCTGYTSCTAAVVAKQAANFAAQKVFALWQALDNNVGGANGTGFAFARSLMGTATSNATYGSAGQVVTGLSMGTGDGYSNYNGGYVSFKASDFHGLTLQENLTWSKALGLGAYNQSTSSIAAEDNWNLAQQYGRQSFDQKIIFNTFIVYQTPWYRDQRGILGRVAGGWTLSPVVTAGTGQPQQCVSNNNGQNFGGEDGANFTDSENCIFNAKPSAGLLHTYRGITGGPDSNNINVGTSVHAGSPSASINVFTNPAAIYDLTRPPILGLDARDGGSGPLSSLGYVNLDLSVKKQIAVYERFSLEASGVFFNALNHTDLGLPSLSLQSVSSFGVVKSQYNSPRQIQMGLRANF